MSAGRVSNQPFQPTLDADVARKVVILLGKMKSETANSGRRLASYFGAITAAFAPF
jgi:hypothetical protein